MSIRDFPAYRRHCLAEEQAGDGMLAEPETVYPHDKSWGAVTDRYSILSRSLVLLETEDELCAESNPDPAWLRDRERAIRQAATDAGRLVQAAQAMADELAARLTLKGRLEASVAVKGVAAE